MNTKKNILIAPLDWGLGHATRCIPIIEALLATNKYKVFVASSGLQQSIIQQHFLHRIQYINLGGYGIKYSKYKLLLPVKIFIQIPKILFSIYTEKQWLKKVIAQHNINMVISDNRYGLFNANVPCVFITHQLQIQTPYKWLTAWVQTLNFNRIQHFNALWVPDVKETEQSLAGIVSHTKQMPVLPTTYLGVLSRFFSKEKQLPLAVIKNKLLIVLSGPEPQRTVFEEIIIESLNKHASFFSNYQMVMLRALPNDSTESTSLSFPKNIQIYNNLPTDVLGKHFETAEYIVSRSGYTTVMDIMALQKKSIVVPTPAQTEQEYLAQSLQKNNYSIAYNQSEFCLKTALQAAEQKAYAYLSVPANDEALIQQSVQQILK